ncbi:hypothetical protein K439DRAFT_1547669 [Ramaria rubella]|nr:hypothetical protein K439DRAFT_1547669 [Ramaria rubella]
MGVVRHPWLWQAICFRPQHDVVHQIKVTHCTIHTMSLRSYAPSELATKATTFGNWTTAVRLRNGASVPPDIKQDLSTLLAFKLPRSLMKLREVEGFASSRINPFLWSILQWGLNNVVEFQDKDTEQIGSKTFSQRQGIDDLLDCAFLPGSEMPLNVIIQFQGWAMFDQESRTFMEPVVDPKTFVCPNAIADAIVIIHRQ